MIFFTGYFLKWPLCIEYYFADYLFQDAQFNPPDFCTVNNFRNFTSQYFWIFEHLTEEIFLLVMAYLLRL